MTNRKRLLNSEQSRRNEGVFRRKRREKESGERKENREMSEI